MARKVKLTADQVARKAARAARLALIGEAIGEGRAYLTTSFGPFVVRGYNDDSGWALCNNTGSYLHQRSFMVCSDHIKIAAEPVYRDERRNTSREVVLDGRPVVVTESDVVRVWNWPAGVQR